VTTGTGKGATTVETWQVYGLGGELLAEYAANGSPSTAQKEYGYRNGQLLVTAGPSANIRWLVTDHLGTPRMVFDQSGSLTTMSRHDYLPFGEELFAGTGNRTTAQGYSLNDGVRQKFTSKERDIETGLDYFLARYYSSTQGRFTSADEPLADQNEDDPQSWNLYPYVGNNPLRFTDPFGLWKWIDPDENGKRFIQWEEGDDWVSLSNFLYNETGRTYLVNDLRDTYGSGGLGANTIIDITGGPRYFTNTGGLKDESMEFYLTVLPVFRGAKVAGGVLRGAWRGVAGLFAKEEAANLVRQEATNLLEQELAQVSKGNLKHIAQHLDEFKRLDPSMTVDKVVELGQQIVSKAENLVSTPGGRKVFDQIVNIGGKEVKVRAVLNPSGGLRSVFIKTR
jgi:RHS repeat-associated protein